MSSTTLPERKLGIVARVGGWAARHRRLVLLGWIVVLVGSLGISHAVGTNYSTNFSLPGTESQRATDLLKQDFPAQSGDSDQIVVRAREGQITDPAVRAQVESMLKEVAALPHVVGVVSPTRPLARTRYPPTGRSRSPRSTSMSVPASFPTRRSKTSSPPPSAPARRSSRCSSAARRSNRHRNRPSGRPPRWRCSRP